jgi:hypothetical protein
VSKQVISGNVFIIPNMLFKPSSESEFHVEQFNRSTKPRIEKVVGRSVSEDEVYVQVWAYDPNDNNSNWADHSWPGKEITRFPQYLPLKELEGLKEGETIVLNSENFEISLTANQLGTRYRSFGRFEEVLKERKEVFDAWENGETIYIGGIPCSKND